MTAPRSAGARSRHAGDGTVPQHTTDQEMQAARFVLACRHELERSPAGRALVLAASDYITKDTA